MFYLLKSCIDNDNSEHAETGYTLMELKRIFLNSNGYNSTEMTDEQINELFNVSTGLGNDFNNYLLNYENIGTLYYSNGVSAKGIFGGILDLINAAKDFFTKTIYYNCGILTLDAGEYIGVNHAELASAGYRSFDIICQKPIYKLLTYTDTTTFSYKFGEDKYATDTAKILGLNDYLDEISGLTEESILKLNDAEIKEYQNNGYLDDNKKLRTEEKVIL